MNSIIENLLQIQALELQPCEKPTADPKIKILRKKVPSEVLIYFDRFLQRGKQGAAFVRNGVCAQCHMQVAIGLLASLHRPENMHRCQNCGVYLAVEEATPIEMPVKNVKPRSRANMQSC